MKLYSVLLLGLLLLCNRICLTLLLFRPGQQVPDPSDPTIINEVGMFSASYYFDKKRKKMLISCRHTEKK